jgi:hypothetical protein
MSAHNMRCCPESLQMESCCTVSSQTKAARAVLAGEEVVSNGGWA